MNRQRLAFGAVAALSGALGVGNACLDPMTQCRSDASPPNTTSVALASLQHNATHGDSNEGSSTASWGLRCLSALGGHLHVPSLPAQLLPLSSLADGSSYADMDTSAASPSSAMAAGALATDMDGERGSNDTITGVFHRLDPQRAKLVLVQVVFRHGARTTLSRRSEMWGDTQWDVCGQEYQAAAVRVFSTSGQENPESRHDLRLRSAVLPGGCRKGELTRLGQQQALQLGVWLREQYVLRRGFMPATHQPGLLEARSTNVSRTLATLRGVLTGLYPDLATPAAAAAVAGAAAGSTGSGKQQQQQGLTHGSQQGQQQQQAAPASGPELRVTVSGDLDEILYADTATCPHLGSFQAMAKEAGRAAIRADPEFQWARGELLRLLNLDTESADWVFTDVHDVLTSLAAHGKPLPPGFHGHRRLLEAVDRLATLEFATEIAPSLTAPLTLAHGRSVLRLSMGRLLHTLMDNMRGAAAAGAGTAGAAAEGAGGVGGAVGSPRMYLYSGHDSTIMPLLAALGLDVTHWPPYLSNLVFELWELPPPPPPQQPPPPSSSSSSAAATAAAASPPPPPPPRYVVRVLYNLQELPLPHCPPGYLPSLPTFEREVVGPFLLSAARHAELCRVRVQHDSSMPQPEGKPAAAAAPVAAAAAATAAGGSAPSSAA
ncbi:hypothetical protein Agub_g6146 [Astrephomene gubernaculifera]|uniref:Acid phosphatase n=1 Tax=Astrephomene gubernaculifera TaxID=47775 RepID=A0AAD3HLK3_9CHLO|nr:hypothetical protein Agub_g6146 [Astrephomene gubernaculifera]